MSVRVRLTRVGSRKNPIWRVVVADQRSPRDGRVIESIGHYNPQTQPSTIVIDRDRLDHWLERGARPTNTVRKLMRAENTASQAVATAEPDAALPEVAGETKAVEAPGADAAESESETPTPEADAGAAEPGPAAPESSDEPAGENDTQAG